jgi:glycosyltransferase involved in cell wall biosynthesis
MHGINPGEAPRFFRQVEALRRYPQIKIAVITLDKDLFGQRPDNVFCLRPPVFPPDAGLESSVSERRPLTLGFFGQYRREKNLEAFLTAFCQGQFNIPVKLFVQGATVLAEDAADFERIRQKYAQKPNIEFLHKALIGKDWQQAIAGVDALIMPYAAERYRYHWSAMLFTAIGFNKPVIIADSINPEVFAQYQIGVPFRPQGEGELRAALEAFVNTYTTKAPVYRSELARANGDFAPAGFVAGLLRLIDNKKEDD